MFTAADSCPVCWQDFGVNGLTCHMLDCGHSFCPKCINGFLNQRTCPSCRKAISPNATLESFPRCIIAEQMGATLFAQRIEINQLKPLAVLAGGLEPSLLPAMRSISEVIKENREMKAELTELKKNVEFLLDCRGGQLDAMVWMTEQYQKHMIEVRAKEGEERKKREEEEAAAALAASLKRKREEEEEEARKRAQKQPPVCWYWTKGKCNRGRHCVNRHFH